jgi:dienelactone hydrolase
MPSSDSTRMAPAVYRGSEPFAFVSYSHADAAAMDAMRALTDAGIRVYYDEGIHPGTSWHGEIATAIETCALFVVLITPSAVASQHVQRELSFALEANRPVLPVLLEDTAIPAGVRLQLGDRQAIIRSRFDAETFYARLVDAVRPHVESARPSGSTATVAPAPQIRAPASRRHWTVIAGLAVVLVAAGGYLGYQRWEAARSTAAAYQRTIATARKLIEQDQYGAAFVRLQPLMTSDPQPALESLWQQIVFPITPLIAQDGATVYFKPYDETDAPWTRAGASPFDSPVDAPRGVLRLKVEKPGYRTGYFALANPGPSLQSTEVLAKDALPGFQPPPAPLELAADGALPDDLVLVPHSNVPVFLTGWSPSYFGGGQHDIPAFAIGRTEVTNRQFKAFVDAGGYDNPAYWQGLKFVDDGQALSFDEARTRFVDRTGRAGPAGWQLGTFATGDGELPVGGISWYEAVAYARFRGLTLPTVHHWLRGAFGPYEGVFPTAPTIAQSSRYLSNEPVAAHGEVGLGPWGTLNAAGNVREWVWNFAGDKALVLGGGWSDYPATYNYAYTASPMDRGLDYGLRLMQLQGDASIPPELLAPITLSLDSDYAAREPVSDDAFSAMRFQFTASHRVPKHVTVERVDQSDTWVADEVALEFSANDTFTLYVIRPSDTHNPSLQPIIYGPSGDSIDAARPNRRALTGLFFADFIPASGRALVIPIWALSYSRYEPMPTTMEAIQDRFRRAPLAWYKDLVTTLDYLTTRGDMNMDELGFIGFSLGASMIAPPLLAIDGHFKAAVLVSAGIWTAFPLHPMLDSINYAPRITLPVLMINGRYDTLFPREAAQQRLFDLLGTDPEDKRQVFYDAAHVTLIGNRGKREVSDWFDRYLGTPRS